MPKQIKRLLFVIGCTILQSMLTLVVAAVICYFRPTQDLDRVWIGAMLLTLYVWRYDDLWERRKG